MERWKSFGQIRTNRIEFVKKWKELISFED